MDSAGTSSIGELIEKDGNNTYALGVLYVCASVYALRRLLVLWRATKNRWDTGLLFVASILFASLIRAFSFVALAVLSFLDLNISPSAGQQPTQQQVFYQRLLAVLFNTGDWAAVSTYLLLIVVWVTFIQKHRAHLYEPGKMRRDWTIAYIVLNSLLYAVQIGLYIAAFLAPSSSDAILTAIYVTIAFLNLVTPAIWVITWMAFSYCAFAGYPYRSPAAKSASQRLGRLVAGWTAGRVLWALCAVLTANDAFQEGVADIGSWLFTVVIVTLFVVAELVPFLSSLGTPVLQLFAPVPLFETSDGIDTAIGASINAAPATSAPEMAMMTGSFTDLHLLDHHRDEADGDNEYDAHVPLLRAEELRRVDGDTSVRVDLETGRALSTRLSASASAAVPARRENSSLHIRAPAASSVPSPGLRRNFNADTNSVTSHTANVSTPKRVVWAHDVVGGRSSASDGIDADGRDHAEIQIRRPSMSAGVGPAISPPPFLSRQKSASKAPILATHPGSTRVA